MSDLKPIYTPDNVNIAYQLNWSLTAFCKAPLPPPSQWLDSLKSQTERDAVRILEFREVRPSVYQFFLSTQPRIAPVQSIRSIKGRLQAIVRGYCPKLFKRNYRFESLGETNNECLQRYVEKQPERHRMADPRVQQRITEMQFFDPDVDLTAIRYNSHSQFIVNLHLVLENREHFVDVSESSLVTTRGMIIRVAAKNKYLLSRMGLVSNHVHLLVGCEMNSDPLSVALAFMNNIAFAHDMKPLLEYSFYAGTFGPYDRDAVRRWV